VTATNRYRRNRRKALGAYQDDLCFFCDEPMIYLDPSKCYNGIDTNDDQQASFDHYVSRRRGGGGLRENIVIAHRACNSLKGGHEPSPEFDEKLRALNIRRGYGDEYGNVPDELVYRRLRPEEFGPHLGSLVYLCDLANNQTDGRLRDTIAKRIKKHIRLISDLSAVENLGARREAIIAVGRYRSEQEYLLPEPFDTLLDNVRATLTKIHLDKAAKRKYSVKRKAPAGNPTGTFEEGDTA
jgi:hypothetical protein